MMTEKRLYIGNLLFEKYRLGQKPVISVCERMLLGSELFTFGDPALCIR